LFLLFNITGCYAGGQYSCGLHRFVSHYEIEYHILKIECSTGRIDTLY
jgi:hypothetical protein